MEANKFKDKVHNVLKKENRLWNEEKTELNQTLLLDILENFNEKNLELYESIISSFLEDEELKTKFFLKIKDIFVFKTSDFKFFMEENKVYNSFTQYKNRIGLTDGKRFLKDSADVVLNFPYKDCVLEGGQSTEEGLDSYYEYDETVTKTDEKKGYKAKSYNLKQSKRNEIFFNQILAKDEIDRLFDKKAFINWKRLTIDGEVSVNEIKRDEDGTIKENLIIKGNNLLALHSLKSQFKGKVKLIYIDPPYNTGGDSFKYNDRFNHSTWLTFMKNRLEIAYELLSIDGAIFIQLDHNEQAYLKVLMDEIFGHDNFRNEIVWKRSQNISSISGVFKRAHDSILFYSKSKSFELTRLFREHEESYLKQYDKFDEKGQYRHVPLLVSGKRTGITGRPWKGIDPNIYGKNGMHWLTTHEKLEKLDSEGLIYWPKNGGQPMRKYYLEDSEGRQVDDIWDDIKLVSPSSKEGLGFVGQKPEELLERIILASTQENDIILDYHLGSGTTCAVAHKMNRQYIGIEQMEYLESLTIERLQSVINGDTTGISKSISWNGGGEFIYCELAPYNVKAKEEINNCKTHEELEKLFDTLYDKYFLNYNLKVKEFKDKVIKEENFIALSLEEQKKMFLTMLDLNQMYVQYSEMKDNKYDIDEESQKLTNKFYSDK
ncbi:site-specific DNA-methyltransferase [Aliarcobacter butzleri]|uniref:site-specific DNA-methyltransferase n=1 Tax=Aliarcobacter butzleri TaxID=28197 RepID=UPI0021B5E2AB|nr:site-specific DNA-methyltransferase [Aliarcobacter butzleri]MCT7579770.1 site-specific DNA-methyltransferase [Aliarcobacter butzleri]